MSSMIEDAERWVAANVANGRSGDGVVEMVEGLLSHIEEVEGALGEIRSDCTKAATIIGQHAFTDSGQALASVEGRSHD